jgi:hypothetical protein
VNKAAAKDKSRSFAALRMTERKATAEAKAKGEKQIPAGMTNKKGKGNSKRQQLATG